MYDATGAPAFVTFWGMVGYGLLTVGTAAMAHGDRTILGGLLFVAGVIVSVVAWVRRKFLYQY